MVIEGSGHEAIKEAIGRSRGLHYDSRQIQPGQIFVAVRGEVVDGNRYVPQALQRGASAIISEAPKPAGIAVPWLQVTNARSALAAAAAEWFGHPADKLRLVGVTGTNGKTTTAFLVEAMLNANGLQSGLLGTIEYHTGTETLAAEHTTPESYDLQQLFALMVQAGSKAAVMEVSSHALALDRTWGVPFEVGIFTNLTQDHLDYHVTMEAYGRAKKRLFEGVGAPPPRAAVVFHDDPAWRTMTEGFNGRVITYGFAQGAGLRASEMENRLEGMRFTVHGAGGWKAQVRTPLMGQVNANNIMAALGAGLAMGLEPERAVAGVESLTGVRGRFARIDEGQKFAVIVDFAHTPDALEQLLVLGREIMKREAALTGRLLLLFACGGERDRVKRPMMGEIAARGSDWFVITSDNPRHEDPQEIIEEVQLGVQAVLGKPGPSEIDRGKAIRRAVSTARRGDLLLVAGKGHERYQIVKDEYIPFNDSAEVKKAIAANC